MGVFDRVRTALREARVTAQLSYFRAFKRRTLRFQDHRYPYFYNRYNPTYSNERAVEIPIAWEAVKRSAPERVLEVGNVLAHYFPVHHQVVDKYEQATGVINADVVEFTPDKHFDLIVAISTLEHVGWDEEPRDPEKFLRAIDQLTTLLAPGGTLLATLPLGYNPSVDRFLAERRIPFTTVGYLKRVSRDGQWREATWNEVEGSVYLHGRRNSLGMWIPATAQAVVVGTIVHG